MLEHHSQAGTQQPQLMLISHLQLAVFIPHQGDVLPAHYNRAFAWFFKKVNAAQEGTLAGSRRADNGDHIARVSLQRYPFQHLVFAVALVQICNV